MKERIEAGPDVASDAEELADSYIAAAIATFRGGGIDGARALGVCPAGDEVTGDPSALQTPTPVARRFSLDPAHLAYARNARLALLEAFGPDASAPERLLLDMVATELPIHGTLVEAEAQLSARLEQLLLHDDIKSVSVLAKALRNVQIVSHAVGRRVETVLGTAVALRSQRRLVELHHGGTAK